MPFTVCVMRAACKTPSAPAKATSAVNTITPLNAAPTAVITGGDGATAGGKSAATVTVRLPFANVTTPSLLKWRKPDMSKVCFKPSLSKCADIVAPRSTTVKPYTVPPGNVKRAAAVTVPTNAV